MIRKHLYWKSEFTINFELFWNALSNMFDHHSFTDRGKFVDYTMTVDRDNVSYGIELIEKF